MHPALHKDFGEMESVVAQVDPLARVFGTHKIVSPALNAEIHHAAEKRDVDLAGLSK
ncbi:MAG: hypothetical protein ABSH47_23195 [Bryobacteraceae bacterium]|jgi:hypothetical protein